MELALLGSLWLCFSMTFQRAGEQRGAAPLPRWLAVLPGFTLSGLVSRNSPAYERAETEEAVASGE